MSVPQPAPKDVIKAALMQPVPCMVCGSVFRDCPCEPTSDPVEYALDWQADLIAQALDQYGHLAAAPAPPEGETIEDHAKWLAEESMHPRYYDATGVDTDRWRKLLDSVADVTVAYTAALKAHPQPAREYENRLSSVRHDLLRYATGAARRRAEGVG